VATNYQANNRHSTAREELMRYTTPKPLLFVQLIFAMIDQPLCLLGCPAHAQNKRVGSLPNELAQGIVELLDKLGQ
jgi:hypothetical protein